MPRAGLSPSAVVEAALAVVDQDGAEGLTLAAVAARTGVATPSLYKHVSGLAELRRLVALRVQDELGQRLTAAVMGRSRDEAVAAAMTAVREYVVEYPARYAAMPPQPLGDAILAPAGNRLLDAILSVLRGYDLTGEAAIHAARRLRAAIHGFASLEAAGGFGLPADLDDSFAGLIDMVTASLRRPPDAYHGERQLRAS